MQDPAHDRPGGRPAADDLPAPERIVALVDDDVELCIALATLMRSAGFEVETFASAEQFLESGRRESIRCLVLDLGLPGMGGLELLGQLSASSWRTPIVCITGQPELDGKLAEQVLQAGARAILYKPFDSEALLKALQSDAVRRPEGADLEDTGKGSCGGTPRS
jgi:FixJ family two-component response regulator